MEVSDVVVNIREHGKSLDDSKRRVQCNYCGKVVSGFTRLKFHLGGIRGDVLPCEQVPSNIKEAFRSELIEKKRGNLSKEVGQLCHPNLPWKRNWSPSTSHHIPKNDNNMKNLENTKQQPSSPRSNKRAKKVQYTNIVIPSNKKMLREATAGAPIEDASSDSLPGVLKCIGRFFYETGIDFSAAESPSFQRMVDAIRRSCNEESARFIPSYQQLRGRILKDEVKEMQHYVKEVRSSWANTGCSILLDGWTDGDGRNLINIIVDCPRGPIYLRSLDISAALTNVNSLLLLLEQVIEEVGVENVVQIVTYSTSTCMETVGKQLMNKYKNLFWAVSASHCLELMLEKMSSLDLVRGILEKAKTITKLIYSSATLLKLMRNYTDSHDLVKPSRIRSAIPFLTLENMVSEEYNLKEMFNSYDWGSSVWASSVEGRRVADLVVTDHSFWNGARMVVKTTIPIVRVMSLIYEGDKPLLGFIYETIDQAKETIKEEVKRKKAHYMPFWEIIDDIWDNKLYSPLHSAGYFLNPCLFYSSDFFADAEVASGLLCYIVRMVQVKHIQDLVSMQVDAYREARGSFGEGHEPSQRSSISPDIWWSKYGRQYPELQRLAIRALSQTCDGASKYQLRRSLAEELLTNKGRRNPIEQHRLEDLTFLHYNLQLQNFEPGASATTDEEIDPMSDWVVDNDKATYAAADDTFVQSGELSSWMELIDCGDQMTTTTATINTSTGKQLNVRKGYLCVLPKEEPK